MSVNATRATLITWLLGLVVFLTALTGRIYYLHEFQMLDAGPNQVWQVQGRGLIVLPPQVTEMDQLVANTKKDGILSGFQCRTPLGPDKDELTVHQAPLYPLFRAGVELGAEKVNEYLAITAGAGVRYLQALLGSLTCLLYYIIAWRAFGQNHLLALAAGLMTAVYPMWIVNVAELEDGVLSSFLLAWSLSLGVRIGQRGGVTRSLLWGIVLAALTLTRAAMLPFAVVVQLWFFLRCKRVPQGWLCGVLTLAGFAAGLTPWVLHCYETFKTPVPIVSSAWFHVWVGNNEASNGADYQWSMKKNLERVDPVLVKTLESMPPQDRYSQLAEPVLREITEKPWETCKRRFKAFMQYMVGSNAISGTHFWPGEAAVKPQIWVRSALLGPLALILALAVLGWRWSYGWKYHSAPISLALFWIPVCYVLSHAGQLHGARLPLDGVLILMAAVGVVGMLPGFGSSLLAGENAE